MADTIRKQRSDGLVSIPAVSALIEAGDLVWYSSGSASPASSQADAGSEPLNQETFARLFLGVSQDRSPSGTTDNIIVDVSPLSEYQFACPSTTWNIGDLVGASENSGGDGLEDQQVELVTDPAEAIGVSVQEDSAAATTVKVLLFSRYAGLRTLDRLGGAGANVQTLTGALSIAAGAPKYQFLDPGGADRTVTLPAEAEGAEFVIYNTADADETITVNNDGASGEVYLRRAEHAHLVCDGTNWRIVEQSFDGPEPAATETLSDNKVLTDLDLPTQRLDPGGAGRDVTLPAEGALNRPFLIVNTADAAEVLTIKNDGGSTLGTPTQAESALCVPDGTNWVVIVGANS